MGERPLVAVIVPAHRVEDYVEAALESVRAQTHTRWECVCVDDGSPDRSGERAAAVAARDPRIRLVRQENRGVSAARNTGLAHVSAAATHVAFLDGDDAWVPTALEDLLAALDAAPGAAGAWGHAELVDERGRSTAPGQHAARQLDRRRLGPRRAGRRRLEAVGAAEAMTFDEAVVVSPIWPPAVALHRRATADRVGAFDTSLRQCEDWDWYLRALRGGVYAPLLRTVALYRSHPGQVTHRNAENVVQADAVRRKTWAAAENSPHQRRTATTAWRALQLRRAARTAERCARALAARRWAAGGRLAVAAAVLAVQLAGSGPPRSRERLVRWSGRTV